MWQSIVDFIIYINTDGDKRTFGYYLMKPWQTVFIGLVYILLVTVIGPKFMKNRKPYTLKHTLIVYNAVQVLLSLYLFIEAYRMWGDIRTWFQCIPIPAPDENHILSVKYQIADPIGHSIWIHYIYYIAKYIELLDTVFFVMRKKYNQVSFLHVYHHSSMPFMTCISLRFAPSSSLTFIGFLNSFVHIIMYGYYLFAALGPRFHKYLTWKKYLTTLQLIQFVTMFLHYVIVAFSGGPCNIPRFLLAFVFGTVVINFTLFGLFYRRSYKPNDKVSRKEINGHTPIRKGIKSS